MKKYLFLLFLCLIVAKTNAQDTTHHTFSKKKILREVEVVTEKPFMVQDGDKKVYSVEKSITSSGGTVTDILQTIPSVNVDIDGNVALRGDQNVSILIDGKQVMTTDTKAQILQQMPANMIEKIEVITNPSAKYDAEGSSGIINIVTKKNLKDRFSGSVSANWMIPNKAGANTNLNYKNKKVNINFSYSYNHNPRVQSGYKNRTSNFNDTISYQNQTNIEHQKHENQSVKFGLDYSVTKKTTLSFSTWMNTGNSVEPEDIYTARLDALHDTTKTLWQHNDQTDKRYTVFGSVGFKREFDRKGQELTGDLTVSTNQRQDNVSTLNNGLKFQNNYNKGFQNDYVFKADYSHPIDDTKKVETGAKGTIRDIYGNYYLEQYDTTHEVFVAQTALNHVFRYLEQIYAAYFSYNQTVGNVNFNVGTRAEQTFVRANVTNAPAPVSQHYFNLFPSGSLNYKFGKYEQQLHLGYSLRIRRAQTQELLPFKNITDPLNVRIGNPDLGPEIHHSLETSYSLTVREQYFSMGAFYRYTLGDIARIVDVSRDGISTTSFQNIDKIQSLGLEFVMRNSLFKIWDITTSANPNRAQYISQQGTQIIRNGGWNTNVKILSTVRFWQGTYFQVAANFQSAGYNLQGHSQPTAYMDLGIRKSFLKNKLSATFNVSDVFNTNRNLMDITGDHFTQVVLRKRESRTYNLSLTYKFGTKTDRASRKQRKEDLLTDPNGGGGGDD